MYQLMTQLLLLLHTPHKVHLVVVSYGMLQEYQLLAIA